MSGIEMQLWRRRREQTRGFALVLLLTWLMSWIAPGAALAQSEADRATARNLAAEGYTALKTQDYHTAEDRFRRADALVHAPTLVVDHARALIGLGRYVEAQERLELVIREGVPDNAPWVWKKSLQEADQLLGAAKPKVAWLTINVSGPSDPVVLVDGLQVPVAALGVRRAVDPGPRRIGATASGYLPKDVTIAMPEGGERAVTLDLSPDPGLTQTPTPVRKPKKNQTHVPSNQAKPPNNTLAFVVLGLGGAGLVVGGVSGAIALGKRSDLLKMCPNRVCAYPSNQPPTEQRALADEYHRYGTISGIGFGVGLASTAVGVWMLLTNKRTEAPQQPDRAAVVPYVTPEDIGLRGAF